MAFLDTGNPTSQDVAECAARIFDGDMAAPVIRLVEGTGNTTFTISLEDVKEVNILLQSSKSWHDKISVAPDIGAGCRNTVQVSLIGILTSPERHSLKRHCKELSLPKSQIGKVTKAFDAAVKESLAPWTVIESRFNNAHNGRDRLKACTLGQDWGVDEEGDTKETRRERQVQKRRLEFVLLTGPTIIQEMLEDLMITTVKHMVPDLNTSLVPVLLSEVTACRFTRWPSVPDRTTPGFSGSTLAGSAVEGGACLRDAAESEAARTHWLWALFNLKNDFVNEWYAFSRSVQVIGKNNTNAERDEVVMRLDSIRERLPFWARRAEGVEVKGVSLVGKDAKFVDGLTVTVGSEGKVVGTVSSEQISDWRVRAWKDFDVKGLERWTISGPKVDLKGSSVDNVPMLVCHVLGKK
ncbi:hypothetical protein QBC44DRAFT_375621 [Cladorrhinum sp. PSN332]|nr:hypothetical protein QBC44DRAFT_375621 [Cladorrhinum sp. PSN332]